MWGDGDELIEDEWGMDDEEVQDLDVLAQLASTAAGSKNPPSVKMLLAGNYLKGHVVLNALPISIENPEGSTRFDLKNTPPKWSTVMQHHYGDIVGSRGMDGDAVDVFLNPGTPLDWYGTVFVVDQVKQDGSADEHKVMLGFDTEGEARAAYMSNYQRGWKGLGDITAVSMSDFKNWLKGDTSKPFMETTRAPQQPDVQPVAGVVERGPAGGGAEPARGGRAVGQPAADAGRAWMPRSAEPAPGGGAPAAVGTPGGGADAVAGPALATKTTTKPGRPKTDEQASAVRPADDPASLTDAEAFAQDYAAFAGRTLEQQVLVQETGATATLRMDAAKAMRALDQREKSLRDLLDCLRGKS